MEFQFAPNPGEPARPLRAIASSGELARVMLALKTVLATEDQIPVLVFDEVDANVGGETANAVGEKMQQIAQKRQVLCITHLPQVAAPASAHYVATKHSRPAAPLRKSRLDAKERVTELARMLGGQTDAARKHAEALLKGLQADPGGWSRDCLIGPGNSPGPCRPIPVRAASVWPATPKRLSRGARADRSCSACVPLVFR